VISTTTSLDLEQRQVRSLELALAAARTAGENRGQEIVLLDLRCVTQFFDFFVIATGTSRRQLHAMSEEIDRVLKHELHDRCIGREGLVDSRWILLDYGSLVIHLFDKESREYYSLESLWAEAPHLDWQQSGVHLPARATLLAPSAPCVEDKEIA
jgi:ribosome-associated protein